MREARQLAAFGLLGNRTGPDPDAVAVHLTGGRK
jgi:hypothetical protein